MSSARWLTPVWRFACLGTAALLAIGSANAQVGTSTSSAHDAAPISSVESSSTEWTFVNGDGKDALPSAPEPAAAGAGGQYDNKGGGGGNGGWSSKLALEFGGGFDVPLGNSSNYVNTGWDLAFGGGWRFSRALSALVEYQFMSAGLPAAVVAEAGTQAGNVHIWGFSVDPVYDIWPKASNGAYVTGGAGFFRKVTNFQNAEPQQYCYYFYCGVGYGNQTVGHFSSNQAGINVGGGYRHKFTGMYGDGRMEIYAEARFVDVFTPAVVNQSPNGLGNTTIGAGTRLMPINFGMRF
jgi:hypothetical protein